MEPLHHEDRPHWFRQQRYESQVLEPFPGIPLKQPVQLEAVEQELPEAVALEQEPVVELEREPVQLEAVVHHLQLICPNIEARLTW
jgi:hypothetical protein